MGIYVFMERIKVNPGRVDINPLTPSDTLDNELTGGYIFKVDKTTAGGVVAWESPHYGAAPSTNYTTFQLHDPDITALHPYQLNYLQSYVTTWEDILMDSLLFDHPLVGYRQSPHFFSKSDSAKAEKFTRVHYGTSTLPLAIQIIATVPILKVGKWTLIIFAPEA